MGEKSFIPLLIFAAGTLLVAKGATRWAFQRMALLLVLGITIAIWGGISVWHLPVELMPNTASETVTVTVNVRGGMSPQDVETLICRPLEDTLGDLSRLENMVSSARKDRGVVSLQLEPGSDMKSATAEVHARLERVMNRLPAEIEKPVVAHYEESDAPVFMAAFTSDRHSPEEMRHMIETRFKDRLQRVTGVANVEVGGGRENKILVEVDKDRLSAFRLSINQIVHRLGRRNVTTQVGTLTGQERSAAVRIVGTLAGIEDMKRLPIGRDPNGGTVLLGQVAEVTDSYMEAESLSRLNGRAAVSLYIQKESSANTLQTAREVERAMDTAWKELPPDLRRSVQKVVVSNQAETIAASLESVRMSLLSGVLLIVLVIAAFQSKTAVTRRRGRWLLAVLLGVLVIASVFSVNQSRLEIPLVVFLFLLMGMAVWDKDLRPAFVVGGSIPASALISFILFRMCGLSLNVMSLFGLALGMGMLVDNAIVVYENILHCREQTGPVADPAAQAMAATEQMVLPMIGATVTNAVTFLPFIFLSKNLQLMYWDVAAAVGASHFASVLVSLTVVPILSLKLLESKEINVRQPKALKHFLPFPSLKNLFALWSAGVSPAWFKIKTFAGETPALQTSNRSEEWTNAIKRTAPTAITFIALLLIGLMILGWKGPSKWTYALVATLTTGVGLSLLRRYETIWHDLLKNRGKVLAGALALALAGGWILAKATDRDFESSGELDEFVIFVELSSGVKLDVANSVIHQVETRLNQDPQVARSILTAVARIEGWSSKLYITLRPRAERPLSTTRVIDRLRKSLDNVGRDVDENAFVHFSSPQTGREMTVQIQGPDYGVMEQLAQEVTAGLETIKGLADVKMRFRPGRPQVIVNVTPDSAARRGLTVDEVVETVHGQVRGLRATLLRSRSTQTEVIVRLRSADREKIQTLVDLPLLTRRGDRVRLGEVATLQLGQMPNEVFRENKQRLLQITANREKISLSRSAEEILKVLERIKFPRDYFGSLAGDYKETMRGFRQLSWGLLAMLVAVYLVLVVLFESVLQPLVIMATVPLCLIGVAWGLAVLGLPLSTGVMVGMMMLGGIVVNNGIMLLDHFNRHSPVGTGPLSTASGTENSIPCDQQYSVKAIDLPPASGEAQRLWDALRLASLARRRPILLTAGSAILGFLPLMLDTSETGALWRPLSVAMVFGLLVSTILTLFVVPCLTFALKQDVPRLLHRSNSPLLPVTTPSKLLQVVHNFFFES